jgi:hypothetical protein
MNRADVSFDTRPEKVIRKSLWRWWIVVVAFLTWLLWYAKPSETLALPILISLAGIPLGWLFGYKLGVAPLFLRIYSFASPSAEGGSTKTMDCEAARKKIDFFFSTPGVPSRSQETVLDNALYNHMTVGTTVGHHNVSCQSCWDYYQGLKREHCGG